LINLFLYFTLKAEDPACADTCDTPQWEDHEVVFPINQYYNVGVSYSIRCRYCYYAQKEIRINEFNVIKNGTGVFPDSAALFPEIYDKILSMLLVDFQYCNQYFSIDTCGKFAITYKIRFRIPKCWRMYFDEVDTNVKSYRVCWQDKCCIHEYFITICVDDSFTPPIYWLNRSKTVNIISDSDTCTSEYGYNCFDVCNLYFTQKRHGIRLVVPNSPRVSLPESNNQLETYDFIVVNNKNNSQIKISHKELFEFENIRIFDILGREIKDYILLIKSTINESILDISRMKNGIYYLTIDNNGKVLFIKKFFVIN